MNRTLPMCCLTILSILVLAWVLPLLYDTALLKSLDRTHYFYSPVLKKFIYTEQTHASDPQAAQKADGHHADIVYKDEDGNYHDRLAFEAALPFMNNVVITWGIKRDNLGFRFCVFEKFCNFIDEYIAGKGAARAPL